MRENINRSTIDLSWKEIIKVITRHVYIHKFPRRSVQNQQVIVWTSTVTLRTHEGYMQRDSRNAIHEGEEMESENEMYTAHDWKDPV